MKESKARISKRCFTKNFLQKDTTNWSYDVYTKTKIMDDTVPSYCLESFSEAYNEISMKKTALTKTQNGNQKKIKIKKFKKI